MAVFLFADLGRRRGRACNIGYQWACTGYQCHSHGSID
jgi:hypothetical protein